MLKKLYLLVAKHQKLDSILYAVIPFSKFKNYKLLSQNKLQKYFTPKAGLKELGMAYSRFRKINEEIFEPPIVLLNKRKSCKKAF